MCFCYLFSAKSVWQLVNRKTDFFYKTKFMDGRACWPHLRRSTHTANYTSVDRNALTALLDLQTSQNCWWCCPWLVPRQTKSSSQKRVKENPEDTADKALAQYWDDAEGSTLMHNCRNKVHNKPTPESGFVVDLVPTIVQQLTRFWLIQSVVQSVCSRRAS